MKIVVREDSLESSAKVASNIPEFDQKFTEEYFAEKIRGKKSLIISGYIDGALAGNIVAYDKYADGSIYCWMVGVLPQFRRHGVLKSMMQYLETWAKNKGYTSIKIKTRNSRREMLLYLVKNRFIFLEVINKEDMADNRILLEKSL